MNESKTYDVPSHMRNIYNTEIVGEINDTPPVINEKNIVIKTKYNGYRMMADSSFNEWVTMFIFPDSDKAEYFAEHFKKGMDYFQDGMLKGNYIFHKINCKYPIPEKIYADQLEVNTQ